MCPAVGYPFWKNIRPCSAELLQDIISSNGCASVFGCMAIHCNDIFNLGCWGFVRSFSSGHPLEQAFQEAQRSRVRFSPGNQEAISCLGTCIWGRHQALLPRPKGPAWGCSLCMLLREPLVPCELLERRTVHACGTLGIVRHRAEGGQASHIPVKQSGRWVSILGCMGHQDVGNPSAKVCASSR